MSVMRQPLTPLPLSIAICFLALLSCGPPTRHVVTDGSHVRLPASQARIGVWGLRPAVTNTVVAWLQQRGFAVVTPAKFQQAFDEEKTHVTRTFKDEPQVLRVAKSMEVEFVVMVQSILEQTVVNRTAANQTPYPSGGSGFTALSVASVSVKGIHVGSGEVAWIGKAHYPEQFTEAGPDILPILTCRALATAWGLHPAGEYSLAPDEHCAR